MAIKSIPKNEVHKITSGQVITDLSSVVKELVENSLDAGSTSIEITFKNQGIDSIEVKDNGAGINKDEFSMICLKHYTSKLRSFDDLGNVTTLGFRGEAMSSLCAISNVAVLTCTSDDYPKATELKFDQSGSLHGQKTVIGGPKGTTVSISNLFHNVPVRRKNVQVNLKREFTKALNELSKYILINPGIKFLVHNINTKANKKSLIYATKGSPKCSILDSALSIFGSNGAHGLVEVNIELKDFEIAAETIVSEFPSTRCVNMKLQGYISNASFGQGRQTTDRQFFFINNRPVNLKHVNKMINELYKSFNRIQYPVFFLNFIISSDQLDINVTPDKRTILLHNENHFLTAIRLRLFDLFDKEAHIVPKSNVHHEFTSKNIPQILAETDNTCSVGETSENQGIDIIQSSKIRKHVHLTIVDKKDTKENFNLSSAEVCEAKSKDQVLRKGVHTLNVTDNEVYETDNIDTLVNKNNSHDEPQPIENELDNSAELTKNGKCKNKSNNNIDVKVGIETNEFYKDQLQNSIMSRSQHDVADKSKKEYLFTRRQSDIRIIKDNNAPNSDTPFVESTIPHSHARAASQTESIGNKEAVHLEEPKTGVCNNQLRRTVHESCHHPKKLKLQGEVQRDEASNNLSSSTGLKIKENLEPYESIAECQNTVYNLETILHASTKDFNLDFVEFGGTKESKDTNRISIDDIQESEHAEEALSIHIKKNDFSKMAVVGQFNLGFIVVSMPVSKNIFIIDQHASDEKHNFEMLYRHSKFQNQKLVSPKILDLNAVEELTVIENVDVFNSNGFHVEIDEESETGSKVKLLTLPVSKNLTFTTKDFFELIYLINSNPNSMSKFVKCSKIYSLFASRACRSSIMIGQHLNKATMSKVVNNLSGLEKPWNCPHGRPTMRHLADINNWPSFSADYRL